MGNTSPDFVKKLYKILECNMYSNIIRWGDTFLILDTNEFTRNILPKHFKHSNFASFVRQLNKYSFSKVKTSSERKKFADDGIWEFKHADFTISSKSRIESIKRKTPSQKVVQSSSDNRSIRALQDQVNDLTSLNAEAKNELESMKEKYAEVMVALGTLVKDFEEHRKETQHLIAYNPNASQIKRESGASTSNLSRALPPTPVTPMYSETIDSPNNVGSVHQPSLSKSKSLIDWSIAPRVLLVEDDDICRRLSTRFLQLFGCEIDVAHDGMSAVSKMNQVKYDLVLMDIVMPELSGLEATTLIRQFDQATPIISMTSNVHTGDVMNYFSHGMNDVLPKPFSRDGLLGMLEKHLLHLKAIQQISRIPTSYIDAKLLSDAEKTITGTYNSLTYQLSEENKSLDSFAIKKEMHELDRIREIDDDGIIGFNE